MHEVALVETLADAVLAQAAGRRVALVRVRVASTVPEDVLRFGWELLAEGGLTGARLVTEPRAVRVDCACGWAGPIGHDELLGPGRAVCPGCGERAAVPRAPELELLEVAFEGG